MAMANHWDAEVLMHKLECMSELCSPGSETLNLPMPMPINVLSKLLSCAVKAGLWHMTESSA